MASTSDVSTTSISIDDILQQLSVGITPTRSAIYDALRSLQAPNDIQYRLRVVLLNDGTILSLPMYEYVDHYYFIILLKCLRYNTSIVHLKIYAAMDDDVMKEFSTMLGHNHYIKKIHIIRHPITRQSEKYLVEALKINTSLTELFISSLQDDPNDMNNHFFIEDILEYLKLNTTIVILSLAIYNLSEININHICNILIRNNTLERLYLGYCNINVDDVNRIISCLKYNTNLRALDLSDNKSNIDTINVIADVLKYNNTINIIFIDFVYDPSDVIDHQLIDDNTRDDIEKYNDAINNLSQSVYQNISIRYLHGIELTNKIMKVLHRNIDNSNIRYQQLLNVLLESL